MIILKRDRENALLAHIDHLEKHLDAQERELVENAGFAEESLLIQESQQQAQEAEMQEEMQGKQEDQQLDQVEEGLKRGETPV